MIHPGSYQSIGELLRDALVQFKTETALIEANRARENARLTYLDFKRAAEPFARLLQDSGVEAGTRVAIVMSNQSKWLLSAYAAFFRGAILVPIDYKLDAADQRALLAHCKPHVLVTEHGIWRDLSRDTSELPASLRHVFVTEAPSDADMGAARRWESSDEHDGLAPVFVPRRREDPATIVYSSGTSGNPKGCVLTHDNYLEQLASLTALYPLVVGHRYFSILPTNHAIDFMCGFIGPFAGGATVVHQRTLRPEFILDTMRRHRITHMALVPLVLSAFERAIREQLTELPGYKRTLVESLTAANAALTERKPLTGLSRILLKPIHDAFGGALELFFCGGAFVERRLAQFFYDLGIPVVIGYGLTEACTVVTVNDLKPFRADSVGRPVAGMEIDVRNSDPATGVGEVWVRGRTVMQGYLDDPDQTAEVLQDGWLRTGDLGYLDAAYHLHLVGRSKNMIVTPGGKNIYPEDIEGSFGSIPCDELAVFASNYVWPDRKLTDEMLVAVVRGAEREGFVDVFKAQNLKLPEHKRVRALLSWPKEFPRTASMKLKRDVLAAALRDQHADAAVVML